MTFWQFFLRSSRPFFITDIGVHSGESVSVEFLPAPVGSGVWFCRADLPGSPLIPAHWSFVSSTLFNTTLEAKNSGASISTVEHLLAALWALNITDALIKVWGPEIPILDGSSAPWLALLRDLPQQQGLGTRKPPALYISEPVRVESDHGFLEAKPANSLSVSMMVPLDNGTRQTFTYKEGDSFMDNLANARTFSFRKNVEHMQAQGLIKGGSLDNALVLENGQPLNPGGWRAPDECARHKVLDFLGDWFLSGYALKARVSGYVSGHTLNALLVKKLVQRTQTTPIYPQENRPELAAFFKTQISAAQTYV